KKHLRWIRYCAKAGGRHLEDTELAHRTEPVLHGADDAMGMMPLAFEIQDGVDDVLERLRPGERAVLGDMAYKKGRDVLSFRGEQQLSRRLADLTDAARGRLELQREDRLHGIDDDKGRLDACDLLEDPLETGLGQQLH